MASSSPAPAIVWVPFADSPTSTAPVAGSTAPTTTPLSTLGDGSGSSDPGSSSTMTPAEAVSTVEDALPSAGISGSQWLIAAAVVLMGMAIGTVVRRMIRRIAQRTKAGATAVQISARIASSVIVLVAAFIALTVLGVDLGPILAGAGVLGVVLGFALKDITENYVSGVLIGFNNPFEPGDQIIINDGQLDGTVEELQLRYTVIRTGPGVRLLVPNSIVIKSPLENLTTNGTRRSEFVIGVGFDSDLDQVRELAIKTLLDVDGVLPDPRPEAYVVELAASWVNINLRFWHLHPRRVAHEVKSRAIIAVFAAMNEAGVSMPYKKVTLQIDGGPDAPDLAGDTDSTGSDPAS
ncbi:MAG: mechanosensitive ion channel family protein [Acidimicrobiales bacterium]